MTTLGDLFDARTLDERIDGSYVRVQRHPSLPLRILNYTEKAVYERKPIVAQAWAAIYPAHERPFVNRGEDVA